MLSATSDVGTCHTGPEASDHEMSHSGGALHVQAFSCGCRQTSLGGGCHKGWVSVPVGISGCTRCFAFLAIHCVHYLFQALWGKVLSLGSAHKCCLHPLAPLSMPAPACFTQSLSQDPTTHRVLTNTGWQDYQG